MDCDSVFDQPLPKKISFTSPPPTTTTATAALTPEVTPKRQVRLCEDTVRSNGKSVTTQGIPKTHSIVLAADLNRWKNDSKTLSCVRSKLQQKQHSTDSLFGQSLWAIAMAAVPALANSAAQFFLPLVFLAFFHDTGLFDKLELDLFAQSFPSDWSFRKFIIHQAVPDTIVLGNTMSHSKMFVACDKGNKKGVGHFAKMLSKWKPEGGVTLQLLDIDAAGGTSAEAAAAIKSSLSKLKNNEEDNTHLLHGQSTDSGGGGTLESLHTALKAEGLCSPEDEYKIGNCTIHATQTQLKNAVQNTFGFGALDKINVMQLLHSVYRLQESIDLAEWRHILQKSSEFVVNYNPSVVDTMTPINANDRNSLQFYKSHNKVLGFHSKHKKETVDPSGQCKGTTLAKQQQPILSRWWTVGSAASYTFDYYLVLFHACQTVVNLFTSATTPHGIASDLFAMMSDQENFVDMTLIRSYNKAYLNPHLDWLQSNKDLTGHQAFQAHQVAVRYFCMHKDLEHIIRTGRKMEDYHEAVARWNGPEETMEADKERHTKKLTVFLNTAHASLKKHYQRWLKPSLLPAALMSEAPAAKVVAAMLLGAPKMPSFANDPTVKDDSRITGKILHKSVVHKRDLDLYQFDRFLRKMIDKDVQCCQYSQHAAQLVLNGVDMWQFEYQEQDGLHGHWRWYMHSAHLPLPHQTQFVESAVKEAKNVSATDRSEQMRSCLAIVRSCTPLTMSGKMANQQKILSIVKSASDRTRPHKEWIRAQHERKCDQRFNTLLCSLSQQGHFRNERVDNKMLSVDVQGSQFKKQNKNQQAKQQHMTSAVTGMIPCTKVTKKRNMEDIFMEIQFRLWQLNYQTPTPKTMPLRKDLLKRLETIRLVEEESMPVANANEHTVFVIQSEAQFKLSDED